MCKHVTWYDISFIPKLSLTLHVTALHLVLHWFVLQSFSVWRPFEYNFVPGHFLCDSKYDWRFNGRAIIVSVPYKFCIPPLKKYTLPPVSNPFSQKGLHLENHLLPTLYPEDLCTCKKLLCVKTDDGLFWKSACAGIVVPLPESPRCLRTKPHWEGD